MKVPRGTMPTGIRFIPEIKSFYMEEAVKNGRSFNSEIMQALKNEMECRIEKRKESKAA